MRVIIGLIVLLVLFLGPIAPHSVLAATNPYFPLETGLHFSYASEYSPTSERYWTVVGTEMFFGHEVWVFQLNDLYGAPTRFEFYSIAADGDVLHHGTRMTLPNGDLFERVSDPPTRMLDMPLVHGHTWTDIYSNVAYLNGILNGTSPGNLFTGEIISTDDAVTVPAGSFSAIQVSRILESSSSSQIQYNTYWFAENTGMVRKEFHTNDFPHVSTEELWDLPLAEENFSWGSVKALYR